MAETIQTYTDRKVAARYADELEALYPGQTFIVLRDPQGINWAVAEMKNGRIADYAGPRPRKARK